jgi:TolB-like protein
MTPDRRREIAELYHSARESSAERRAELLAQADPELRRHVESLLARPEESLPDTEVRTATVMQPGARFGPYQVESKLGAGGMGDVFRAIDTRLGRAVAIKTTHEQFGARFEREGRAISSLNHPNICALYDVGPNYLVMELVEGETIAARLQSGPIAVPTAISYASQIAAALVEAHGKGIVHRDLKPANIMIAKSGIKVLDFGLAKSSVDETITASRMILGTPAYMAPEQREGRPADARSDIYSFGCVFHEMLSGSRPSSQRKRMPSRRLETIVARCLEQDPERRWQSAAELERELASVAAGVSAVPAILAACGVAALLGVAGFTWMHRPAPSAIHSLAILGLENRSGDAGQDYFADGLTNSLAAGLARLNGLRVIPPASTQTYRGMKKPLTEIGKELNVDVLLDGTVSQTGNRLEIRIRLVNTSSGRDRWTHTYAGTAADLPASQNQIERDLAAQLQTSAPDRARMIDTRKLDPRAYDLYLRGSYHVGRYSAQDTDEAIRLFEQAIAIAPDFAPLQGNLASAYAEKSFAYAPNDRDCEERAFAAIQKAFALDPDSAEAHLARGRLLWRQSHGFPHRAAIAEFRLAAAARPNLGAAWSEIASVLIHVGHLDEALLELRKAEALSPGETSASGRVFEVYLMQGKPQMALEERTHTQNGSGAPIMAFNHAWALIDLGRFEEAARAIRTDFVGLKAGAEGLQHAVSALLGARQGNRRAAESEIRAALAETQGFGQFHHLTFMIACAYSVLGDVERAQEWMEKTAAGGFPCFTLFEVEPGLERWRATPQGHEFLANLRREWASAL